jgi:hypothetical protein
LYRYTEVDVEDIKEMLKAHPRLAPEYRALRDEAMKCHCARLRAAVGAAEMKGGAHVVRRDALDEGLRRHCVALALTGHDEATVESAVGPGITKRMNALRRAGNKEAAAAAAVAATAVAVAAQAAQAAADKRRSALAVGAVQVASS